MGNPGGGHLWPRILLIAIALVVVSFNGASVSDDAYLYSSPSPSSPPPYLYRSPPPPTPVYEPSYVNKSSPPPYVYSSPPPAVKSPPPPPYFYSSPPPPPPVNSPPPPYYHYTSPAITIKGSGVLLASDPLTYCVAKSFGADENTLLDALNWVCGKVDCSPLQQGQSCYEPDTIVAHASYAFNQYYQERGMITGTCDFNGTAAVTSTNPSHGECTFSDRWTAPIVSPGSSIQFRGTWWTIYEKRIFLIIVVIF